MREWWGEWYNKYAVIALGVAGGYGIFHVFCWSKLTPSDVGTWVGAIGTVGTLVGAIYIAHLETNRAREEKIDLALVHTPAVAIAVAEVLPYIEKAIETLQDIPGDPDIWAFWASEIGHHRLWSTEQMQALVVLPDRCAVQLALTAESLRQFVEGMRSNDGADRVAAYGLLVQARLSCRDIQRILEEAIK